jgi:hypothetical protein
MPIGACVTSNARIEKAATIQGRAQAKPQIPEEPATCTKHMDRVTPKTGDKFRWVQAQWELNADAVDLQIDNCAAFHRDLKSKMEAP